MLRTWAMAEVVNPRWAPNLAGVQWSATLRAKMDAGQWNALTEDEWLVVEHVLLRLRALLLDGLLPLQPKWYEGELPIAVVAEMGFMRFKKETPASGRLADYAEGERGTQAREPEFNRARMVGVPVAVGPSLEGRLILGRGLHPLLPCSPRPQHWPLRWPADAHGGGRDGADSGVGAVVKRASEKAAR